MLAVVALTVGSAGAAPAQVGAWTAPFEEGGARTPRCVTGSDGRLYCKPTAVGSAFMYTGDVLYMNGVEGNENIQYQYVSEVAPEGRDSLSRVLSLRSGKPSWTIPSPETAGASNPAIDPGSDGLDDPMGYLGVPARPGDGLVGSVWGTAGLPPSEPVSPPDDIQENDGDLFCTDQVQLSDGRLLIAGGSDFYNEPAVTDRDSGGPYDVGVLEIEGLRSTRIYDPSTRRYGQTGDMKYGRWYPSLVTMPDGNVLVVSGVTKLIKSTQLGQVRRTEIFNPATGRWSENYVGLASENSLPLYPRLSLMPNGKVFYSAAGQTFGPNGMGADEELWAIQQFWNQSTKEWEIVGLAPFGTRGGATQVALAMDPPYNKASLLLFGGTLRPTPGSGLALPLSTLITVDAAGNVSNELAGLMNNRRWFSSGVTLPDGSVVAVSGADRDEVLPWSGSELPVREAELFDPATKTWSRLASASRDRTYHNSALLLPDGRVLVGGHAPIGSFYGAQHDLVPGVTANNDRDASFEVFSPPYLFRGPRPKLAGVQRGIKWGTRFQISTPNASQITQVVLSRLPSPQHTVDTDARTLRLAFTRSAGTLTATAPPNGVAAPPGYYYLFIIKGTGASAVPSVARIVHVGSAANTKATTPLYASDDPPPPSGSATPLEDSSYLNQPPPLPVGLGVVGVGLVGAGAAMIPARRRRFEEDPA